MFNRHVFALLGSTTVRGYSQSGDGGAMVVLDFQERPRF
jgi:hypothetical protein